MNEKAKERLLKRINKIRETLESEEEKKGWITDRRGLRYLPTEMYLKIRDYQAALTYLQWFRKNFPKDQGFPEFLYDWTVILFKNGRFKEAKQKAFETYCSNIYFFDKYFGNEVKPVDMVEKKKTESFHQIKFIHLSSGSYELKDFDKWLQEFITSDQFIEISNRFIAIRKQLKTEKNLETRKKLARQEKNLVYEFQL